MKRTIKKDKRLLLSFEKVRDLTPLSNDQLKDVNGGACADTTQLSGVSTCPYSMNHNRRRLQW